METDVEVGRLYQSKYPLCSVELVLHSSTIQNTIDSWGSPPAAEGETVGVAAVGTAAGEDENAEVEIDNAVDENEAVVSVISAQISYIFTKLIRDAITSRSD